jgi:esterase/lipase superfamily enzyme
MLYFITNREILNEGSPNQRIRENGRDAPGDNLRYGIFFPGKPKGKDFEIFPEPKDETESLYLGMDTKDVESLNGSARMFKHLYDDMCRGGRQDVLFFIHGFNTDLNGVRDNFIDLKRCYIDNPDSPIEHVVIFTWPGRSPKVPLHYRDDAKDAERSGAALGRAFQSLIRFFTNYLGKEKHEPCNQRIHLMLHSMGHRVFRHVIDNHLRNNVTGYQPFHEILCIAADVPYNIFEKEHAFHALLDYGERVHVYFHQKDRVLDISKYTKNFSNMLGRHGRKHRPSDQAYVVDCDVTATNDDPGTKLRDRQLNHWYYYTSSDVVKDIIMVLKGGESQYRI